MSEATHPTAVGSASEAPPSPSATKPSGADAGAGAGAGAGASEGSSSPSSPKPESEAPSSDGSPFAVGARVSVAFGDPPKCNQDLVVKSVRVVDGKPVYEAEFAAWKLAHGAKPRGYFQGSALKAREPSVPEILDDAQELRLAGNEFFKADECEKALGFYRQSLLRVASLGSCSYQQLQPHLQTLVKLRLTTMSNITMCFMKVSPPKYKQAITIATDALKLDPQNATNTRSKLLFRRATSYIKTEQYQAAIDDLEDPLFKGDSLAEKKLLFARSKLAQQKKKQTKKDQAMWSQAFNKNSEEPEDLSPVSASPAGSPKKSPAAADSLRMSLEENLAKTEAIVEEADEDGDDDDDEDDDGGVWKLVVGGLVLAGAVAAAVWYKSKSSARRR